MFCFSSNMPNRDPVICQEFLPPDFSTAVDNHSFFLQFHIFISSQHTVYSMSRDGKDGNLHIFPVDFWCRLMTINWQLGPQGTLFSKISTYVTRVFCINSHLWALETHCLEKKKNMSSPSSVSIYEPWKMTALLIKARLLGSSWSNS